ncbi:MAG TPA: NMD protein affecting ribosome stability and mRNA decay [Candidatus Methanoperedenaceae archaeon]|nr:NMD protein affecting ribosome stability and mRNA decay [Candidatus Methanoperedenaceae archaeon]
MKQSFCPKCGNPSDDFVGNVCRQCFLSDFMLATCPKVGQVRVCQSCFALFRRGKWTAPSGSEESDITEAVRTAAEDAVEINNEAKNAQVTISVKRLDHSRFAAHAAVNAEVRGAKVSGECDIEMRILWETCSTCGRLSGGYYAGIVQLRAEGRFPQKHELDRCEEIANRVVDSAMAKGDRTSFISKVEELREGRDIYIGSTKVGRQICRAITDALGGRYTDSPKLVGRKNGEDVYRITYALRLPPYMCGDIILADERVVEVSSCGKRIWGIELATGARFTENYDDILEIKKLCSRADAVKAVLVSVEKDVVHVLDPQTYEPVLLKKPEFLKAGSGSEISVVKTSRGMFILPD